MGRFLDDELILASDTPGEYELHPRALTTARLYHIQISFFDITGDAMLVLLWQNDLGLVRQPVPQSAFFHSKSLLGLFPKQVVSPSHRPRPAPV